MEELNLNININIIGIKSVYDMFGASRMFETDKEELSMLSNYKKCAKHLVSRIRFDKKNITMLNDYFEIIEELKSLLRQIITQDELIDSMPMALFIKKVIGEMEKEVRYI